MIRGRTEGKDGRPGVLLGLTSENVRRLVAGEPILVTGDSVEVPSLGNIMIYFGGETEVDCLETLRAASAVDETTDVHYENEPPSGVTP